MDIQNKVVIVTGASAGIGLAAAQCLAAAGAQLVLAARTAAAIEKTAQELQQKGTAALAVPTDMRDRAQVERLVEAVLARFGHIDVLINNAGQSVAGTVETLGLDDFRQIIELNLIAPVYAMQRVIPPMRQNGGGLIVNISSMVSKMNIPGLSGYACTKSALNQLSATARAELAADNIRVITVYPRMTATGFAQNALGSRELRHQQRSSASAAMRPDTPEFVAGKILEAVQKEPAEQYMDV